MEQSTLELTALEKERLQKIEQKQKNGIFELAFCGHFSAGKSTLLNGLLGAEVLPTSPIPTSANIIKIAKGETALELSGPDGAVLKRFEKELPWDRLGEWGRDGETIEHIRIQAPISFLSANGVIVDTPGVDSTDPTHAAVTMEQLYSTDAVCYVMDYNHVQSETNLHFLKQLTQAAKPVIIVINQVDKHHDSELSADAFLQQVEETLRLWHIQPTAIYFTSMKVPDHPLNQFDQLRAKLFNVLQQSSSFSGSAEAALQKGFYESLSERIRHDMEEAREMVYEQANREGYSKENVLELESLAQEKEKLDHFAEAATEKYEDALKRLYENVHLLPYHTMELLEKYVESRQSGFKVGLLFSSKKTKEEQDNRLSQLTIEINDNLKSQLLYYIEDYFRTVPVRSLQNKDTFLEEMNKLDISVEPSFIADKVTSKSVNREYLYTLSKQMNSEIVTSVRRQADKLLQLYIEGLQDKMSEESRLLSEKMNQFSKIESLHSRMMSINEEEKELLELAKAYKPRSGAVKPLSDLIADTDSASVPDEDQELWKGIELSVKPEGTKRQIVSFSQQRLFTEHPLMEAERVRDWASDLIYSVITARSAKRMLKAADAVTKAEYTVSLFGAFSAGKSSFANALLGDAVMPVSPHPTTATVNTVRKPEGSHQHGDADIIFKNRTELSDEIKSVAQSLQLDLDIDSLPKWNARSLGSLSKSRKTAADYLQILQVAIREQANLLGTVQTESADSLAPFTAVEQTACLIKEIQIYYSCRLTEAGITLTDTPGVNSIHGRHTNVAYDQLKRSDAIFYLTYYNHAFSKSDEYFLQQLSSINQFFTENKMYFVLNASDLARDEAELAEVEEHVLAQLKRGGFGAPRLYSVSSRGAFDKALDDDSFEQFEEHFYEQIIAQLRQIAVDVMHDRVREAEHEMTEYVRLMRSDDRTELSAQRAKEVNAAIDDISGESFQYMIRDAEKELEQLALYLRKRMQYVLNDYYGEAVNVSVLQADSKRELQQELKEAVSHWAASGREFLRQEWAAAAVRLDYAVQRIVRRWFEEYEAELKGRVEGISIDQPPISVQIDTGLPSVQLIEDPEQYKKYAKSKREFFEQNKTKELKEQLLREAEEKVTLVLSRQEDQAKQELASRLKELAVQCRQAVTEQLNEEKERLELLSDPDQLAVLEQKLEHIPAPEEKGSFI
ncbi:dynamin family protein [Alkalicoccus luteus]|uniref:Dynamin N-terminal domain-containing protein n=1 Tax=Alkalicoccus luteus TaxID=1237094 RepID=A0A969PTI2_9BACI|nr:dynamin family protein [Alkalicoccus luteus]NJP37264.1 hypothetical protein [Alkalicoccus luteus]